MRVGDLVRVRSTFSFCQNLGIIVDMDHNFYKMHRGNSQNRLHVLWQDGSISCDPESYVKCISDAK